MQGYRKYLLWTLVTLSGLISLAWLADRLFPPDLSRYETRSVQVLAADGSLLRAFTTRDDTWRLPLTPAEVDPLFLTLLQAYEDRRFATHPGVDPLAIVRAAGQWLQQGNVVSGASTLTMQTARLLEPRPRGLSRKLLDTLRALQLEWRYSKDEILAMYLTLAPYGGNLEGLHAATLAYFGKSPQRLTPAEAALLTVLPQAPSQLRPDRYPDRARAARDKVLTRMVQLGVLSAAQAAEARQDAIPERRRDMPFHAPHLAQRLAAAQPQQPTQRTFINPRLQAPLEALARRLQSRLDERASLAILVVDNKTRQVLAYVAASDFFADRRAGQVDMVRAIRSPGSTLKPFIYGLGFEDLVIHPETLIDDIPTRFGDYAPSNFHDTFRGQLSVREALQRSLNIPAVRVLEQVGPARAAVRLREAGMQLYWNAGAAPPGLPLVLGGVGTTLEDLVTLYAGIANGGLTAPLVYTTADPAPAPQRFLSETACWYLARVLEDAPPPESVVVADNRRSPRLIAHKTGTSYGFRDAWALGFDRQYTVGVWVGRPDGSPSPGRYGRNTAAPLLFQVFDLLPAPGGLPPAAPGGVLTATAAHELPPRLRRLHAPTTVQRTADRLLITFPVNGSTVELASHAGQLEALPLLASGGQRPLRWLVNGLPLHTPLWQRKAFWQPDGEGFIRITVIDGQGQSAQADVWVAKSEADSDG